mmetsp:Transcript_41391/g.123595  ORF Transcript_41391/g.123595 Transcript_41391/m.123595 type:complete len:234 (+) Transcript_41391:1145-1846(+)
MVARLLLQLVGSGVPVALHGGVDCAGEGVGVVPKVACVGALLKALCPSPHGSPGCGHCGRRTPAVRSKVAPAVASAGPRGARGVWSGAAGAGSARVEVRVAAGSVWQVRVRRRAAAVRAMMCATCLHAVPHRLQFCPKGVEGSSSPGPMSAFLKHRARMPALVALALQPAGAQDVGAAKRQCQRRIQPGAPLHHAGGLRATNLSAGRPRAPPGGRSTRQQQQRQQRECGSAVG